MRRREGSTTARAQLQVVASQAGQFFGFRRRVDSRLDFSWHYHRDYELVLIERSRGRSFAGDSITDYSDGDLVLIGPNLPHTWCSEEGMTGDHVALVAWFEAGIFGKDGLKGLPVGPVRTLLERSVRGLRFTGKTRAQVGAQMQRLSALGSPLRQFAELLVMLDVLSTSTDVEFLSSRSFLPDFRPEAEHPIDRVCSLLNEKFQQTITLDSVADIAGMSVSAFCRYFRRTTGKSFNTYLNELRLGHACRLLAETDRGIADIASASGFPNVSNFNRRFLRFKKARPSEFRKEYRRFQR